MYLVIFQPDVQRFVPEKQDKMQTERSLDGVSCVNLGLVRWDELLGAEQSGEISAARLEATLQAGERRDYRSSHTHTHTRRPHAHTHIVEISIKIWSCCVLCFAIISLFTLAVMQKKGKDSLLGFWSLKQHYAEIGIFFLQFGDPAPTDGRIVYPEVKLNRNRWTLYEFHQLHFFNFDVFWWTTVNYSYSLINVRTTGCIR